MAPYMYIHCTVLLQAVLKNLHIGKISQKLCNVPVSFHSHYYNHSAQGHNGLYGQFSILQCHDHAIPDFTFLFRKLRMTLRTTEKASYYSKWSTKP